MSTDNIIARIAITSHISHDACERGIDIGRMTVGDYLGRYLDDMSVCNISLILPWLEKWEPRSPYAGTIIDRMRSVLNKKKGELE